MTECLLCEALLSTHPTWKSLFGREEEKIICESCSKSFQHADIINKTAYLSSVTSLYAYNKAMQDYLHQFKFLQDIALAAVFQKELRRALKDKQHVIPIPVHPEKRVSRTFDQVEALLDCAQVGYESPLEKIELSTMGGKTKQERIATQSLFRLKEGAELKAETYTLVDDIYTTGTTLNHAAKVLRQAGASNVEAVTLIRA